MVDDSRDQKLLSTPVGIGDSGGPESPRRTPEKDSQEKSRKLDDWRLRRAEKIRSEGSRDMDSRRPRQKKSYNSFKKFLGGKRSTTELS